MKGRGRTRVTLTVAAGLAMLLVGGGLAASAVDNGVTADFNPENPNGENQFYTSPVTISFSSAQGDPCEDPLPTAGRPVTRLRSREPALQKIQAAHRTPGRSRSSTTTARRRWTTMRTSSGRPATASRSWSITRRRQRRTTSMGARRCNVIRLPARLAVGVHTVNCSAKDTAGNTTTKSFTITVDGAPTVNVADMTEEATRPPAQMSASPCPPTTPRTTQTQMFLALPRLPILSRSGRPQ